MRSFGVLARGTFPKNCYHERSSYRFAAILVSWTFFLTPGFTQSQFRWRGRRGEEQYLSRRSLSFWAWARATFVSALSICQHLSLLIKTLQPDQTNLKQYALKRWFFSKNSRKLTGRAMVRPRPVLTNRKRPKIQCFWRKQINLVVLLYRVKWSWFTAQAYSHRVCTLELFVVFNIKLKKYNFNIKNKKIYRRQVTEEYTEKNLDMTKPKWVIFKPN